MVNVLVLFGQPIEQEAFDGYFDVNVKMFANDEIFAIGASEGRKKQEPYIEAATSIIGKIVDLNIVEHKNICVFRNLSRFTTKDGKEHQIDGLSWQRWHDGFIIEERYYDGEKMNKLIACGVMDTPAILLDK